MFISTLVNNSFSAIAASQVAKKPLNHVYAAGFVGTSVYVGHEGLMAWLPAGLGYALTGLFVCTAGLQWTAAGRKAECEDHRDEDRANGVTSQAVRFGAIEAVLFAAGSLAIAAKEGAAVYTPMWIAAAAIGAILFAWSSYKVKWTSCDAVTDRRRKPTPQTPASRPVGDNIFDLTTREAVARDGVAIKPDGFATVQTDERQRFQSILADRHAQRIIDANAERRERDKLRKRAARAQLREVRVAAG